MSDLYIPSQKDRKKEHLKIRWLIFLWFFGLAKGCYTSPSPFLGLIGGGAQDGHADAAVGPGGWSIRPIHAEAGWKPPSRLTLETYRILS